MITKKEVLANENIEPPLCPECGSSMVEFERVHDKDAVFIWYSCSREDCMSPRQLYKYNVVKFIWYSCSREDCMGQWLMKRTFAG